MRLVTALAKGRNGQCPPGSPTVAILSPPGPLHPRTAPTGWPQSCCSPTSAPLLSSALTSLTVLLWHCSPWQALPMGLNPQNSCLDLGIPGNSLAVEGTVSAGCVSPHGCGWQRVCPQPGQGLTRDLLSLAAQAELRAEQERGTASGPPRTPSRGAPAGPAGAGGGQASSSQQGYGTVGGGSPPASSLCLAGPLPLVPGGSAWCLGLLRSGHRPPQDQVSGGGGRDAGGWRGEEEHRRHGQRAGLSGRAGAADRGLYYSLQPPRDPRAISA